MRTFTMYRRIPQPETHDDNQMNPPSRPQFQGVEFDDGTVAIRWMTAKPATAVWSSVDDMLAVHGHPEYGSELVWSGGEPDWDVPCCGKSCGMGHGPISVAAGGIEVFCLLPPGHSGSCDPRGGR